VYLLWLVPGEIFGGASLLAKPSAFLVSTETVRDSCVLVWERKTIRGLATRYPKLFETGGDCDRLLDLVSGQPLEPALPHRSPRLAMWLVSLANGMGRTCPSGSNSISRMSS